MPLAVPRVTQRDHMDCGRACLIAALHALGAGRAADAAAGPAAGCCTWSIELLPQAEAAGLSARLHTTQPGCMGRHADAPFYQRHGGDFDRRQAVEALFDTHRRQLFCEPAPVSRERLAAWLGQAVPTAVIVLVDSSQLCCTTCGSGNGGRSTETPAVFCGHYVVLVEVIGAQRVRYMDPAPGRCDPYCSMPLDAFYAARTADGTDNDVVVVMATG